LHAETHITHLGEIGGGAGLVSPIGYILQFFMFFGLQGFSAGQPAVFLSQRQIYCSQRPAAAYVGAVTRSERSRSTLGPPAAAA
jgi:hypothetical protein